MKRCKNWSLLLYHTGIAFVVFSLFILILAGCSVEAKYTDKEGRVFEYRRKGPQQIGEVLLELADGTTFLMDGQKSELPPVKITTTSITIGREEVGQ